MRVHMIDIGEPGMVSLALLFREAGHDVSGSGSPPEIPSALIQPGIVCFPAYSADRVASSPGLVVIGSRVGRENVEAALAEDGRLVRMSMSEALREHFLLKGTPRTPLAICGSGRGVTSAMCASVLHQAGKAPGYFFLTTSANHQTRVALGSTRRKLELSGSLAGAKTGAPFVIEAEEERASYWDDRPKFLDYVHVSGHDVAVFTSAGTQLGLQAERAFSDLAARIPSTGLLVCDSHDESMVRAARGARSPVTYVAVAGNETGAVTPTWLAALAPVDDRGMQPFDLFAGGMSCGRFVLRVSGASHVRNAVAAIAACAEGFGVPVSEARRALANF